PQIPGPVRRMAPKPRRTSLSSPIEKCPDARASGVVDSSQIRCTQDRASATAPRGRRRCGTYVPGMSKRRDLGLLLIGVFKLVHTVSLIAARLSVLLQLESNSVPTLVNWALHLRIDPDNKLIHALL